MEQVKEKSVHGEEISQNVPPWVEVGNFPGSGKL